jgi:hypothetical protein
MKAVSNDLTALAGFIRAARRSANEPIDPSIEQQHLAAIAYASRLEAQSNPVRPSRTAVVLRSRLFKATATAVAAVIATAGLAAAQVLPAPAQDAVAKFANAVGIDLPTSDDAGSPSGSRQDEVYKHRPPHHPGSTVDDSGTGKAGADNGDGVPDDNGDHGGEDPDRRSGEAPGQSGSEPGNSGGAPGRSGSVPGQSSDQGKNGADHSRDGAPDDNGNHGGSAPDAPKPPKEPNGKPPKT